jgi:hypothetical protein
MEPLKERFFCNIAATVGRLSITRESLAQAASRKILAGNLSEASARFTLTPWSGVLRIRLLIPTFPSFWSPCNSSMARWSSRTSRAALPMPSRSEWRWKSVSAQPTVDSSCPDSVLWSAEMPHIGARNPMSEPLSCLWRRAALDPPRTRPAGACPAGR